MTENFPLSNIYNDQNFTIYTLKEFVNVFSEMYILVGME